MGCPLKAHFGVFLNSAERLKQTSIKRPVLHKDVLSH